MSYRHVGRAAPLAAAAVTALCAVFATGALAQDARTRVVVVSGDRAPAGDGLFHAMAPNPHTFSPSTAVLDDAGGVTFSARVVGTGGGGDYHGLFRGDAIGPLVQVFRGGQPLPDGSGHFFSIDPLPAYNNAGQVGFHAALTDPVARGVFRTDGVTVTPIMRHGQPSPDGRGTFWGFDATLSPELSAAGHVAFKGAVTPSGRPGNTYDSIIVRGDGRTLTKIARVGDRVPGDVPYFYQLGPLSMNAAGHVAFHSIVHDRNSTSDDNDERIYRSDGAALTLLARSLTASPDGKGRLLQLSGPKLNNAGQALFSASIGYNPDPEAGGRAIFRADDTGLTLIAREGQSLPGGAGRLQVFEGIAFNNAGQAAFRTRDEGTSFDYDGAGIYLGDGSQLVPVVQQGDPAPGGGRFQKVELPALNDAGQVAFKAIVHTTGVRGYQGLFFSDEELGLIEIVRRDSPFLGSTIAYLDFYGSHNGPDAELAINERGQVAYSFILTDGRYGVAVWTVPEPSAGVVIAAAAAVALLGRRARRSLRPR